jgi:death-on-curing protein
MTFGGADLYPDLASKGTALAFSLIQNHPFVDGNKRVGHAALETFLILNDHELRASVDDAEAMVLAVAASAASRQELEQWVRRSMQPAMK